jgi:1-acyl-sn-glycerol-3-phosphate acyltransferase
MFYRLARRLFLLLAGPLFSFRVEGVEHVPTDGPAILVAPHRSWLDPPAVGAAAPRPVRFLIIDAVYDRPRTRWFYRLMGSIPVRRGESASAIALRAALRGLRAGELLGIFPEGRVVSDGRPASLRPGAAALAVHARAPLVPTSIRGSALAWPHGRRLPGPAPVSVRFEPPLELPPGRNRAAVAEMQRRLEVALEGLE